MKALGFRGFRGWGFKVYPESPSAQEAGFRVQDLLTLSIKITQEPYIVGSLGPKAS